MATRTDHSLVYYVTGHGYGHARRSASIAQALAARYPDLTIHVRTGAPAWVFDGQARAVHHHPILIDRGAVEDNPLAINWPATLADVADLLGRKQAIIASELEFIGRHNVSLLVADIPFLGGYIAQAAQIPCLAVGNFTWDWIYEPHLQSTPAHRDLLPQIRAGYSQMQCLLRLPFSHPMDLFRQVIDVPLVAPFSKGDRQRVLRSIDIAPDDPRRRILIGMRGGISPQALDMAAGHSDQFLFLYGQAPDAPLPPNVHSVTWSPQVTFWDVLCVCDAVVSKLGHGIVTDCAASHTPLLYPQRSDFREDQLLAAGGGACFPLRPIPAADFLAGRWADHLTQLLAMPHPHMSLGTNGAEVCAQLISQWV